MLESGSRVRLYLGQEIKEENAMECVFMGFVTLGTEPAMEVNVDGVVRYVLLSSIVAIDVLYRGGARGRRREDGEAAYFT